MVEPSRALQPVLAQLDGYDTVIVDCPAQFGVMTRLVLAAVHEVIVPTARAPAW
jgi:cellulose biosynthesis protein BcsQ